MLLAAFAFAWMNLLAKYLNDFHPLQVVFFRATGTFVFIFPYLSRYFSGQYNVFL